MREVSDDKSTIASDGIRIVFFFFIVNYTKQKQTSRNFIFSNFPYREILSLTNDIMFVWFFIVGSGKTPSERSEDWPLVGGDESDPHNNNRKMSYRKEGSCISSVEIALYAESFQVQDISESGASSDVRRTFWSD